MPFTEEQIDEYCKGNGFVRTGVFATPEEVAESREWQREMAETPVIRVCGRWLHESAEDIFKRQIDDLAKRHGLPDRGDDHYGLLATGEFTTQAAEVAA